MQLLQAEEITVEQAIQQAPADSAELVAMAAEHRASHTRINHHQTIRHWQPSAGTYCYQTHIAIAGQASERLALLTETLFNAATLLHQPWYPQFAGGKSHMPDACPAKGIGRHQLSWGKFDLGLRSPRYYRQLQSLAQPVEHTSVIVARSVSDGPRLPEGAVLAYTLSPNGEVVHAESGCLHWHHICCTPGAALLPGSLDRWFINCLRRLGLDRAERNTYRLEAETLRDWLQSANPAGDLQYTV